MTSKAPKYRSKLEALVASLLGPLWRYEPFKVAYVTHRNYTPDFVYTTKKQPFQQNFRNFTPRSGGHNMHILVEVKGFFRVGDTQKYKAIRDALKENQELVFFLQSAKTKVRKGAKMNMGQWCEKESIKWFESVEDLKEYADGHF
tara:strand:- start:237 stop:671 length:435 start_codon:yes stop_codon:yes gene_type:complete